MALCETFTDSMNGRFENHHCTLAEFTEEPPFSHSCLHDIRRGKGNPTLGTRSWTINHTQLSFKAAASDLSDAAAAFLSEASL